MYTLEPLLIDVLPMLSKQVKNILFNQSRSDLAHQVDQLRIKNLCECGDPDCGSFYLYLTQYEENDDEVEGFIFGGGTIEVYQGKIGFIEIFPSSEGNEVRNILKEAGIFY
jgi:hypothetical protein